MTKSPKKKTAAKTAAAPKVASHIEFLDFPDGQGSEEWLQARLGLVTASNFGKVMAQGEGLTRARYMKDLAGELLTGMPADSFRSEAMKRGNVMEPEARQDYERRRLVEVRQVGFVKNSGLMRYATVGCSPDGLVDPDGGLECKSIAAALLIDRLEKGATLPSEHRAQVHGCMWVCERQWWDIKLYCPKMPDYTVHVKRDAHYIEMEIRPAVEKFCYDLKQLVENMRARMGGSR